MLTPIPTPSLTPIPTMIPVSCPTVPSEWPLIMNNEFDTNEYSWSTGRDFDDYAYTQLEIVYGFLYYDVQAQQGTFSSTMPVANTLRDFYLSSTMRKIQGPLDAEYGIVFRSAGTQLFFLGIQDSGLVKVHFRDVNYHWQDPIFEGYSQNVKIGESNNVVIFAQGQHYVFCINQVVVGEMDIIYAGFGQIGIGVELENAGDNAIVEYDDLIIYAP
jgi:hypothetical protein